MPIRLNTPHIYRVEGVWTFKFMIKSQYTFRDTSNLILAENFVSRLNNERNF